jgi:hypothetical protein
MHDLLKPEIPYSDLGKCVIGARADVFVKYHPHAQIPVGGAWIKTTKVERIVRHTFNGPVFETQNSKYTPFPADATGEVHETKFNWTPPKVVSA